MFLKIPGAPSRLTVRNGAKVGLDFGLSWAGGGGRLACVVHTRGLFNVLALQTLSFFLGGGGGTDRQYGKLLKNFQ
jgi:hypothetical protein